MTNEELTNSFKMVSMCAIGFLAENLTRPEISKYGDNLAKLHKYYDEDFDTGCSDNGSEIDYLIISLDNLKEAVESYNDLEY